MPRRTKIVATLGPASDDPNVLSGMIDAGLDVVRLNFSHGQHDEMRRRVASVRDIAAQQGHYVGILADLQGPKIRVASFADGAVTLRVDQDFFIDSTLDEHAGSAAGVGTAYADLQDDLNTGDILMLDDGNISLRVESIDGTRINTQVLVGGPLSDHKGINLQGGGLSAPALTEKDREDIQLAAELGRRLCRRVFRAQRRGHRNCQAIAA